LLALTVVDWVDVLQRKTTRNTVVECLVLHYKQNHGFVWICDYEGNPHTFGEIFNLALKLSDLLRISRSTATKLSKDKIGPESEEMDTKLERSVPVNYRFWHYVIRDL
jgi:hypothetical protein